ncbi:uncharacterized protein DS421_13g415120 [Arachis hypogaea]|nr:uncharacterized protein DS421_13g415120 [Arachis hypogaea]
MEYEACQSEATQSSKQATRNRNQARRRRTTCYCGERPVLATSSMVENPWRRFGVVLTLGLEKNAVILYSRTRGRSPTSFKVKNEEQPPPNLGDFYYNDVAGDDEA